MNGHRHAFSLLEVAVALAIMTIGLTAVTTTYMTALRWAAEARYQYSAVQSAQLAIERPELLTSAPADSTSAGYSRTDALASGWLNGYYLVRTITDQTAIANQGGAVYEIDVRVYAGGTDNDGELVHQLQTGMWWTP